MHLSPAEFDAHAHEAVSLHTLADPHQSSEDAPSLPHVAHGCHNHCPLTPDLAEAGTAEILIDGEALYFARNVTKLLPFAEAPPLQPPAA